MLPPSLINQHWEHYFFRDRIATLEPQKLLRDLEEPPLTKAPLTMTMTENLNR